ncbi:hrp65 protein-like isoform X2 [Agrilus planipennis]|uniref:Hrp65 protein-like isoform X2 n=1 Tax=Agrilus planipennis TaxID=224129 RepID=A0A1W4X445_AGRPL|nr:hrp65 protein-like isoform X2 [Agrilus planipennis]
MSHNINVDSDSCTDISRSAVNPICKVEENDRLHNNDRRPSNRHSRNRSSNKYAGGKPKGPQMNQGIKEDSYINDKLNSINQSTDLPPLCLVEQKFSGRSRLFIGNLPSDVTEEEITSLFAKYGETQEVYVNPAKTFAFIKLDYYANAFRAKTELFGYNLRGRHLIIRFTHPAAIYVKNLSPNVTNELLYLAFSVFGDIENCYIIVDEKGKSKGEAVIEFVKKGSATIAAKRCSEGCFILTASLRPVIVEKFEPWFDINGYPEILAKRNEDYYREREMTPRFANPGTFEYDYAKRWKDLHEKYKLKMTSLKSELFYEEQKLEADMIAAQYDHETDRLKKMLQLREMDRERIKQEWELRQRQIEDRCLRERQSYCTSNSISQDENNLYLQASQLNNLLEREEQLQQWQMNHFTSSSSYEQRSDYMKREANDSECWVNLGENYNPRGHKRLRH